MYHELAGQALLARRCDQIVITKLDRLGRSLEHLIELSKQLQAKGVDLVVLDQGIDTSTAMGRMFFQIIGAVAVISSSPDDQASDLGRSVADGVFDLAA